MRFSVLGSGSRGNATLIEAGGTRILIDAGISARQLERRLIGLKTDPHSLDAILLTHEHGDHIAGLRVFLKKYPVPVYANASTCHVVREIIGPAAWKVFVSGAKFEIGAITIESFTVPHDAVEPVGFSFGAESKRVGLLSDAGHITKQMVDRLHGIQALFIEANYDETMLEADTKRPWSIKQRISSRHGHLSNTQTAELIAELVQGGLQRVVLGHLSLDCNTPEIAMAAVKQIGLTVTCSTQNEATEWQFANCQLASGPPLALIDGLRLRTT